MIENTKPSFATCLMIWATSASLSFVVSAVFIFIVVVIAGTIYEKKHPPILGEDDLGGGLVVVFSFAFACFISLPIWVALTLFLKRKITAYFMKGK
jgi:hypothetical protein